MANHIAIGRYLAEARKRGYLKPSKTQDVCLADYVNTANSLLQYIQDAGETGLNTVQLQSRCNLAENTIKIYCRELYKLKLLDRTKEGTVVIWRAK